MYLSNNFDLAILKNSDIVELQKIIDGMLLLIDGVITEKSHIYDIYIYIYLKQI